MQINLIIFVSTTKEKLEIKVHAVIDLKQPFFFLPFNKRVLNMIVCCFGVNSMKRHGVSHDEVRGFIHITV